MSFKNDLKIAWQEIKSSLDNQIPERDELKLLNDVLYENYLQGLMEQEDALLEHEISLFQDQQEGQGDSMDLS